MDDIKPDSQESIDKELREFAKDHFQFSEALRAYFRQLPIMPREARAALKKNICEAQRFTFFEKEELYVKLEKLDRFKQILEFYKTKKINNIS